MHSKLAFKILLWAFLRSPPVRINALIPSLRQATMNSQILCEIHGHWRCTGSTAPQWHLAPRIDFGCIRTGCDSTRVGSQMQTGEVTVPPLALRSSLDPNHFVAAQFGRSFATCPRLQNFWVAVFRHLGNQH